MVMEASDERNAALSTLKQMETLTKRRDKSIKKIQKQMIATIAIHGHEIDDLDQLWTEYRGTRSIFNNEFLELRFELKEHISREDWAKLFSQG